MKSTKRLATLYVVLVLMCCIAAFGFLTLSIRQLCVIELSINQLPLIFLLLASAGVCFAGFGFLLHVNPDLQQKAMLVVYNPTNEPLKEEITVPLGYVGKPSVLQIREREGKTKKVGQRSPMHSISVTARVPAQGWTYFVFE